MLLNTGVMSITKTIKKRLRPLTPKPLMNAFHYGEARAAQIMRRSPSEKLTVIGIVGSKGKTTTANMIWAALQASNAKAGLIGTANIRIGAVERLNPYHLTMPGAFVLQRILGEMVDAGCKYAVMEVPSEGQTQYRHVGIHFDVLVFTNVTEELMASHNFRMDILHKHNKRVFEQTAKQKRKTIGGKKVPQLIIANADSTDMATYTNFAVDKVVSYSSKAKSDYQASDIKTKPDGTDFSVRDVAYHINIVGPINVINATAAIATARELGILPGQIEQGFRDLVSIPGRMEAIDAGQNYTVYVDYAHEEAGMQALMDAASAMRAKSAKVIVLLGAEGGGRDKKKRPIMGEIVGKVADYVVVSNVDPYDDPPMPIIEDIAVGAEKAGKKRDKDLFLIEDRRTGIRQALELAHKGDLVFITGKGSEQTIVIDGKSSPWDDRKVVREELKKLL
jgi:UDP-N-acetylmuramoyl-L-alanyl-D-glutamate--2,6-diaminopimelate ligase